MPEGWWDAATPTCPFQGYKFDVDETPDKIPQPMKKRQQVAAKRLEVQLSQQAQKAPKACAPELAAESKVEKVKPTSKSKEVKPTAKSKGVKPTSKASKPKCGMPAARKPAAGPMMTAMKKFMEGAKKEGFKHSECMKMWMKSTERNAIIDRLPAHERKRRRFEHQ